MPSVISFSVHQRVDYIGKTLTKSCRVGNIFSVAKLFFKLIIMLDRLTERTYILDQENAVILLLEHPVGCLS